MCSLTNDNGVMPFNRVKFLAWHYQVLVRAELTDNSDLFRSLFKVWFADRRTNFTQQPVIRQVSLKTSVTNTHTHTSKGKCILKLFYQCSCLQLLMVTPARSVRYLWCRLVDAGARQTNGVVVVFCCFSPITPDPPSSTNMQPHSRCL